MNQGYNSPFVTLSSNHHDAQGDEPDLNQTPAASDFDNRKIAESILGEIYWCDSFAGYCRCPGEHLHSHRTGQHDCRVLLDGAPTLYCFHTSCSGVVEQANSKLRSGIGRAARGGFIEDWKPSPEDIARRTEKERAEKLKLRAEHSLPRILQQFPVALPDIWDASPVRLDYEARDDWKMHLALFDPGDVVWIGNVYDSGKHEHARNFRTAAEWVKESKAPGEFTCPATFKSNCNSRSNDNVLQRRFLVIESDQLSRVETLAIVQWCRQFMRLRAIICTGSKSLHGWFDFPNEKALAQLKVILPALQCDHQLFKPSQPVRLAGAWREERSRWQSLLWLDLKGAHER
jgi:hypothetical protein